jgi:hypothetical protein
LFSLRCLLVISLATTSRPWDGTVGSRRGERSSGLGNR